MSIYKSIIIAALLVIVIPFVSWSVNRMNKQKSQSLIVTTSGISEIGVKLIPAYPDRSWQEMILTNESNQHIIAVIVIYEVTREDGQMMPLQYIICHPELSLETDPSKIKALLKKYSLLPPHSKWLVGLGVERTQLADTLPTLEETRASAYLQDLVLTPPIKKVHVILDGIIFEDGRTAGPQKNDPRQVIAKTLSPPPEGAK